MAERKKSHKTLESPQIERIARYLDILDDLLTPDMYADLVDRAERDRADIERQVRSTGRR